MGTRSFVVRRVDPSDGLTVYHRTFTVASEDSRVDPVTWTLEEARAFLQHPGSAKYPEAYVTWDGDRPVGADDLLMPLQDDTSKVAFDFGGDGAGVSAAERECEGPTGNRARAGNRAREGTPLEGPSVGERDLSGEGAGHGT